ncbi:uncharacterized protein [Drosophila bipectinata]|uniref:uncharacterized protein n=1 Tax=Drosophila bipectinata TaxID=42026 RepID=UPI001C88E5E8|nr:uncharacterized protein LOC122321634 [Drosophila bipectinata]
MFRKPSLILAICLFLGASQAFKIHAPLRPNAHIQELQAENRELAVTHADSSRTCFDFYSPKLNAILALYETEFEYCTSNYTMAKDIINRNYLPSYYYIGNQLKTSCIHIVDYQIWTREQPTLEELVNRLDYISADSAQSSKTFYGISANATEVATQLEGEYLTLNTQKDICLNNAEVKYVTETADTYDVLNACLRGENNKVIDV